MYGFLAFVLIAIIAALIYFIKYIGVKRTGKKVFYVISFHWLIKMIIKYRIGGYKDDNLET